MSNMYLTENERKILPEIDNIVSKLSRKGQEKIIYAAYGVLMTESVSNTKDIENAEHSTK